MLVRLLAANDKCLQEFLVKSSVESARLGRRAIVFHLDIETILLRFKDEEKARKFTAMVNSVRYSVNIHCLPIKCTNTMYRYIVHR